MAEAQEPIVASDEHTSKDGDLKEDLEEVLAGDFDFKGSFSYAGPYPKAPNPCLSIEGIGSVGLPLSPRDAQLIVELSAQAPFGLNDATIVNTDVRDTWEIEPAKVAFQNPFWEQFIQKEVLTAVTQALGTNVSHMRCELYKLFLYQEGSHFHRHQDTAKSPGMFATIIVILPSSYRGGEVHLSHSTSSQVYDFSSQSALYPAVLAWYTDVVHEVKPVTHGYRLALSYNLIKDPHATMIPRLPDMAAATEEVDRVLQMWKLNGYATGCSDMVAYILAHQYSSSELLRGVASMKGSDAHMLVNLRGLMKARGFEVFLGNLEYHSQGAADDDGHGYHKHGRYDSDSDEDDLDDGTPGMMEVFKRELFVSNLVDLDGANVGCTRLNLEQAQLVPADPFEDADPDSTEYEGYMGNGAGSLDQYYRRTVLIVVHEDNAVAILDGAGAAGSYGFQRLRRSLTASGEEPTPDDVKLASLVVTHLRPQQKDVASALLPYATSWKDFSLWKRVAEWLKFDMKAQTIDEAWKAFGFGLLQTVLEKVLHTANTFSEKMKCLDLFAGMAIGEAEIPLVKSWITKQQESMLLAMTRPLPTDLDFLIPFLQKNGTSWFHDRIYPNIVKDDSMWSFWAQLTTRLYEDRGSLSEPPATNGHHPLCDVDALIDRCLEGALGLWEVKVAAPPAHSYPFYRQPAVRQNVANEPQVQRILAIFDVCITTGRRTSCSLLISDVLKNKPPSPATFSSIYLSLTIGIRKLLDTKALSICEPPFSDIMQVLIGSYLAHALGAKPQPVDMRRFGCGCVNCAAVDAFIQDVTATPETRTLAINLAPKKHLITYLNKALDLIDYQILERGRPQPIVLSRSKGLKAVRSWSKKQAEARAFLRSVGDEDTLGRLVGTRYADVLRAVEGTKPFALPMNVPGATMTADGTAEPQSKGKKRKQPVITDDVIDLTSD